MSRQKWFSRKSSDQCGTFSSVQLNDFSSHKLKGWIVFWIDAYKNIFFEFHRCKFQLRMKLEFTSFWILTPVLIGGGVISSPWPLWEVKFLSRLEAVVHYLLCYVSFMHDYVRYAACGSRNWITNQSIYPEFILKSTIHYPQSSPNPTLSSI